MAETRELAERLELEALLRLAAQRGDDVLAETRPLPERVLGRRRAERAGLQDVGHGGAIAERPHTGGVRDLEILVHDDAAALDPDRERREDRMRRRRHRADEG